VFVVHRLYSISLCVRVGRSVPRNSLHHTKLVLLPFQAARQKVGQFFSQFFDNRSSTVIVVPICGHYFDSLCFHAVLFHVLTSNPNPNGLFSIAALMPDYTIKLE